jgi:hypothetical protein
MRKSHLKWVGPVSQDIYQSGTDVMIFKIYSRKKMAKKMAFLTQNKAKLSKNLIITLTTELWP